MFCYTFDSSADLSQLITIATSAVATQQVIAVEGHRQSLTSGVCRKIEGEWSGKLYVLEIVCVFRISFSVFCWHGLFCSRERKLERLVSVSH